MKSHLNTLFVTTQGAYLGCLRETVKVQVEGETRLRVPIRMLESVVCFGRVGFSQALVDLCCEHDVSLSLMTEWGRFVGRVQGPTSGNVLLRREQYRRADDPVSISTIARGLVLGKVLNCRLVLRRAVREGQDGNGGELENVARSLKNVARTLTSAQSLGVDSIRGHEGEAGRNYFSVFDNLITQQKDSFRFEGRSRRPPLDRVNSLLSFLYSLLVNDVVSALETTGLDPQVGFLHRDRPGRPSLALDLMEELRPILADRIALTLINQRRIKGKGFRFEAAGGVWMDDETRRTVLEVYQERKSQVLLHPFLEEKVTLGLVPLLQARLLARHLRGDLDGYPAFVWR